VRRVSRLLLRPAGDCRFSHQREPATGCARQVTTASPDHGRMPVGARLGEGNEAHRGVPPRVGDHPREKGDPQARRDQFDDKVDLAAPGRDRRLDPMTAAGFEDDRIEREARFEEDEPPSGAAGRRSPACRRTA
jgi:hypothetical protein